MAGNEIVLNEFVIPPPRRRPASRPRLQRRIDPNAPVDSIGDVPGLGHDSGRAEQDVPPPQSERDATRPDMAALAREAVPANTFAGVTAPSLPPSEQVLGDAAGIQIDADDEDDAREATQRAAVGQGPAQLPPDASATRLRAPMEGQAPPASMQLRAPMTGAPIQTPATPALRAPMVAPDALGTPDDDEVDSIGAAEDVPADPGMPPEYEDGEELVSEIGATLKGADRRDPDLDARAQVAREDAADRTQAQRTQRAQRALAILSAVPAVFGGRSGGASGAGLAQLSTQLDPNAPLERIRQRREARDASAREEEEREYSRSLEERRAELENRRIAQAESATEARNRRTSAEFDVDSTDAVAGREAYLATIGGLSEAGAALMSRWIPREFGGDLDLSRQTASGMDRLIAQFNRERDAQAEANPRAFRIGHHGGGGGGRAPRGSLAGLTSSGGPRRGHDYGGTIAAREGEPLTEAELREDAQRQGFGGSVAPARTPEEASQITGDAPDVVRARRRANGQDPETGQPAGYRDPRRAQRPAAQPGRPRPAARAGDDAPVDISVQEPTPEQVRALPIEQRSTVALLRAYQRAHPGSTWEEAVAAAPLLQPAERSSLLAQHGSDTAVQVPGWRQSLNMELQPAELRELRAQNAATERMASASQRMEELAAQISATDLARNIFSGNDAVQDALNISREMQASMRALQNMGVPNGPEMAMALEQAGEIRTPRDLARVIRVYQRLRRWALESNRDRMQSNGFRRRRGGR